MKQKLYTLLAIVIILVAANYFIKNPKPSSPDLIESELLLTESDELKHVENQLVCMINNTVFETPQIPVPVGDKTYYGCCAGCEAALKSDASTRVATDPVSSNEVDKATAVIGANSDGTVFYFENIENLQKYTPGE